MSVHDEPLWNVALDEFDLPNDKAWLDEWVMHCMRLAHPHTEPLGWGSGLSSTGTYVEPMRLEIGSPPQEDLHTPRLWLVKMPGWEAPRVLVVGFTEVEEPDTAFWPEVVRAAMEAVGMSDRPFDWYAVVGPALGTSNLHRYQYLAKPGTLGPVRLQGYEAGYSELDQTLSPSLGRSGSVFNWWPLIVSGTAHGHDWETAQRRTVTAHLHRTCALLTLAWDGCFTVRAYTQPGEFRALPEGPEGEIEQDYLKQRQDVEVPTWGDDAWERLDGNELLRDALAMYHEGCLLEAAHPSFALTAFISTVETVTQLNKDAERCPNPDCNQVIGSTQRFKDAVGEVLSPERAELAATAYTPRSHTVHRGSLHGDEKHIGHHVFGEMFENSVGNFRWVTVRYTKEAAQKWMLRALGGD
jgi:hypothetical protein